MDHLLSLHTPPLTALPSSRKASMEKSSFLSGQTLVVPKSKRGPDARNLKFLDFRARTSGSRTSESNPKTIKSVKQDMLSRDEDLVFVAGATGRVGSRTVRELLKLGFRVRAGVRNAQKAEGLVKSVKQLKLDRAASASGTQRKTRNSCQTYLCLAVTCQEHVKILKEFPLSKMLQETVALSRVPSKFSILPAVEKLEIVECDLERDVIGPAIGNSSVVICCIGASEKEVFDVTGPYRIDYQATKKLVDAATVAKVNHFILLTSLGTNKIGFPASILNLFWGVLIWKRKAEEALIASGLPYTIVRPGGMERPTDAYKETHNLVLANEDTYFGGQVSNLQVAELMAFMAQNRSLSLCKIVEVIAETTAALTPMGELLSKIPSQRVDTSSSKVDSKPDVPPSQAVVPGASTVKEPIQTEVQKTRPLSPYFVYEDLKPPTSPTPTPSSTPGSPKESHVNVQAESTSNPETTQISISGPTTGRIAKELTQTEVPKPRPLSPYIVYEDLKPPTSPIPTQSSSDGRKGEANVAPPAASLPKEVLQVPTENSSPLSPYPVILSPTKIYFHGRKGEANVAPPSASLAKEVPQVQTRNLVPLSPYPTSDGLKPPTSPSPGAPTISLISTSPAESNLQRNQPKARPLSPFTMYKDLKPPSSPIPSSPMQH